MWRDALLIAGKDLRIELRSKVALNQIVPFGLVVLVLFGLGLGPDTALLRTVAPGLFWIAVLLATVLAVQRSFALETADGARDGLRLAGLDPAGVFFGKVLAVSTELLVLEVGLALGASILYDVHLAGALTLLAICVAATLGLVAVGTVYGVVTASSRISETLLPLLFFPVVAPVLLGAVKASRGALAGGGGGYGWLDLLVVFALAYLAVGTVAFGPLLEDA